MFRFLEQADVFRFIHTDSDQHLFVLTKYSNTTSHIRLFLRLDG